MFFVIDSCAWPILAIAKSVLSTPIWDSSFYTISEGLLGSHPSSFKVASELAVESVGLGALDLVVGEEAVELLLEFFQGVERVLPVEALVREDQVDDSVFVLVDEHVLDPAI